MAGFPNAIVTHSKNFYNILALNESGRTEVIPAIPIDPPMMAVNIFVNNSPIGGKEGTKLSSG